jgi:hypothetical protein
MYRKILTVVVLLAGGLVLFSLGQEKASGQETEKLLRIDLLDFERPSLKKSLRNIFIPFSKREQGRRPGAESGPAGAGQRQGNRLPGEAETPSGPGATDAESGLPRIDLRYIGYVGSEARKVALIFRGGEAMAVKRKDILPDGVKIVRITSEEVEVELPGGDNIRFSLEGEEK